MNDILIVGWLEIVVLIMFLRRKYEWDFEMEFEINENNFRFIIF